jgi:hypothetical protein
MSKTLAKLYFGTGALAGGYVCYTNYRNMHKTFPKIQSNETKKRVNILLNSSIMRKSVYYTLFWPVLLTQEIDYIRYPDYNGKITIKDIVDGQQFTYIKQKNQINFQLIVDNNDTQNGTQGILIECDD